MRRSRHHHPRPERPPNLQTLRPNGPVHLKNLPPLNPMNPGCGAAHPAAPFRLAALATHPPGRGWAGKMEERNVASNPAYPILWGGDQTLQTCLSHLWGRGTTPFKLASHRSSGGGGTTKWWRGAAEGGIIKTAAKPPPQSSAQRAVKLKNPWAQAHPS